MNTEQQPLLTLDLGLNGGIKRFDSVDDFHTWINAEFENWKWVITVGENRGLKEVARKVQNYWNTANEMHRRLQQDANEATFNDVKRHMQTEFEKRNIFHSGTPQAEHVLSVAQDDQTKAAFALAYFQRVPIDANSPMALRAAFDAMCVEGMLPDGTVDRAVLDSLRSDFNGVNEEFTTKANELISLFAETKDSFEEFATKSRQTFTSLKADFEQQIESIETDYKTQMALRAPIDYWEDKRTSHERGAKLYGGASVIFGMCAGLLIYWLSTKLFVAEGFNVGEVARFLVLSAIVVWPVRLLVKNYLSNVHLESDAGERVVILKSFLALLREPEVRENEAMATETMPKLFDAIFRHAASGVGPDDAFPQQSVVDALTKLGIRK